MPLKALPIAIAALAAIPGGSSDALAQPASAPGYVGRWAAEASWCRNRPGTTDELPIRLTARGMEGMENSCRFTRIEGASPEWRVARTCQVEGMTQRDRIVLRREGNSLRITYRGPANDSVLYVRCP
ncbi:MAG: hypothetical protein JNK84_08975 [Phreatobacter sp.]|uniref:hypothetical protein n=1 Tax=Phreatobacter sp. TaxID=1966341 RepID=UPI001A446AD7|nr:hypothetical protein [Phreatobacter sp.]MBL8569205.1 hypothetical protein [Phreatobacter sp.]